MNSSFRKLMLASSIPVVLLTWSVGGIAATPSQDVIDARQETQIATTYALNPYLRFSHLNVSVQRGKATLSGSVDDEVNRDLAREVALGVNGIRDVDNQIVVQGNHDMQSTANANRYGEAIDDATITAAIKSKLLWSKHTEGLATSVETRQGRVTLRGTADSLTVKDLAGRLALNTRGVVSVDNQLVADGVRPVAMAPAQDPRDGASTEIADSWITAKVKSTFLYSSNISGSNIAVSTRRGIVTLSGRVDSGAERALAIELTQNVRGVRSVQSSDLTF
ncbi:BON domain-containing protein [Neisseriaceae bacterium JH1-16]|nr:BON domain-containing protein [Neisseriaceae bacterium JH1-16]